MGRPAGRSAGSSGYASRNLESYSARHVAAALEVGEGGGGGREGVGFGVGANDDAWSGVCVRVLPLLSVASLDLPCPAGQA